MFDHLSRRRVAERQGWRFDLFAEGAKFGELRPQDGRWKVLASHVELAYCLRVRLEKLPVNADETTALGAVRAGTADYIRNEDDTAEMFDEAMHRQINEYSVVRADFECDVDSDSVDILKPTVDRLRVIERELHLLPYVIGGAVYNGLGDD